jgi:pyruvate dehydrogenase E1 component alpha subunit
MSSAAVAAHTVTANAPMGRDTDERVRVLDPDGQVVDEDAVPDLPDEQFVDMYRQMWLARHFDERMISLQRQGRMGTYPSLAGQEAAQIGSTHALDEADWINYQYREHGAIMVRGLEPEYLLYWMGHERGNEWLAERNVFPINISIGSHLPHVTGMAWASKLKGEDKTFVCHFGDGATSEGDFHEALNFAGVFDVPAIFFCNNNQYAISIHRDNQTAASTIAQKAQAYGFDGIQVDGMDPLAVYEVTRQAVEKARDPDDGQLRPTLIEAVMYRFGAHTTADDPSEYRDDEEVERWRELDPLPRMEQFLRDRGLLDDDRIETIEEEARDLVAECIDEAMQYEPDPEQLFENAYEAPTPRIEDQREYLRRLRERHGDDELLREE